MSKNVLATILIISIKEGSIFNQKRPELIGERIMLIELLIFEIWKSKVNRFFTHFILIYFILIQGFLLFLMYFNGMSLMVKEF